MVLVDPQREEKCILFIFSDHFLPDVPKEKKKVLIEGI